MIGNIQKGLLHIYKDAAGLDDPTYRSILRECAGVPSAADRRFSQSGFELAMAALETVLFERVQAHLVPNPIGRVRRINSKYYWRKRCPARGYINARQLRTVEQLWAQLKEFLSDEQCTSAYLQGIIHRATDRECGYAALTSREAGFLIDALKDRIVHAISTEPEEVIPF